MDLSHNNTGYFPGMPVCDKHLSTEVSSDFTLPDYQSEIKRLLSTRAYLSIPNEYLGNSNAEIEGNLCYRIIYLGTDGKLYSASLEDKYSFSAPLEFTSNFVNPNDVTLLPECSVEAVNTKVLGPRKLNVRTRLSCNVSAFSPFLHSTALTGTPSPSSVEYLMGNVSCIRIKRAKSESLSLSDFIPLDPQIDNVRVIDSAYSVQIDECIHTPSQIEVRGDVNLKIFYCNDAQSALPLSSVRNLPFTVNIPIDNDTSDCTARGFVDDINLDISENGINIELFLTICAQMQSSENVTYVLDAYSKDHYCEGKNEVFGVWEPLTCKAARLTQNEVFSLDEIKLSKDAKIIDTYARASINETKMENGKMLLLGKIEYQIIYHHDGEYSTATLNAPLRYEVKLNSVPAENDKIKCLANANIISIRTRCDGDRIFFDTELKFNYIIQKENKICALSELKLGEKIHSSDGEIILCYPAHGTPLWNIAKQYKKSMHELKQNNSIPDAEQIVKSKFLVI